MNQEEILKLMIKSACVDGMIEDHERTLLQQKARELNVSFEELDILIESEIKNIAKQKNVSQNLDSGFVVADDLASGFVTDNTSNLTDRSKNHDQEMFTEISVLQSQGAMSLLQKAKYLGKWVVIKRIKPQYKDDKNYQKLFEKEFENAFHLDHQNVVRIYGKSTDKDGLFYYMEYIDGRTITEMIKHAEFSDEKFFINITLQILEALTYVHKKQIFHRDLKPDNILVTFKGDNVKLCDFGLAAADAFQEDLAKAGTPKYAAPEQKEDAAQTDQRTDIYALGLIMLEILTGDVDKMNIFKIKNPDIKEIIKKMLAERPINRYQNCNEVRDALVAQNNKKTFPKWLEDKIIEFAEDGKITEAEHKVLRIDAQNNDIDQKTLNAIIDLHLEKVRSTNQNSKHISKNEDVFSPIEESEKDYQRDIKKRKIIRMIVILVIVSGIALLGFYFYPKYKALYNNEQTTNTTMYIKKDNVNLRKNSDANSEIMATFSKGTEVTVIQRMHYWSRVKIADKEGYIENDDLTDKK